MVTLVKHAVIRVRFYGKVLEEGAASFLFYLVLIYHYIYFINYLISSSWFSFGGNCEKVMKIWCLLLLFDFFYFLITFFVLLLF